LAYNIKTNPESDVHPSALHIKSLLDGGDSRLFNFHAQSKYLPPVATPSDSTASAPLPLASSTSPGRSDGFSRGSVRPIATTADLSADDMDADMDHALSKLEADSCPPEQILLQIASSGSGMCSAKQLWEHGRGNGRGNLKVGGVHGVSHHVSGLCVPVTPVDQSIPFISNCLTTTC